MWTLLAFLFGLGLLVGGAELLVGGASRLARAAGIPPVIVGLTVVAFGTSAPELAVSLTSAFGGRADIAVGNVVGSNVMNVLVILGLSALVTPLVIQEKLVKIDVPIMIGASFLVWFLAADGGISRAEGVLLFALIVAYLAYLGFEARRSAAEARVETPDGPVPRTGREVARDVGALLLGMGGLVWGATLLVDSATVFARWLGLSELVIGLTVVALGTSLPELAASLVAAARGERDLAVGNVVGSNMFNLLAILGATAAVAPGGVPVAAGAVSFDLPVMVAVSVACLPFFVNDYRIARWEGGVFVAYYAAYVAYVVLDATGHDMLPQLSTVLKLFVLPLTAITMVVLLGRAWTNRRRA